MKFIYSLFLIIFSGKFYNKIRNHPLPGAKAIVYNLVFNCLRYPRKVGGGGGGGTWGNFCYFHTPNANMADLSVGPGLVARKRG